MALESSKWVSDLSGNHRVPFYQSVSKCPKCWCPVTQRERRSEEYCVNPNKHKMHLSSYERNTGLKTEIMLLEYMLIRCKDCSFSWIETCGDYVPPIQQHSTVCFCPKHFTSYNLPMRTDSDEERILIEAQQEVDALAPGATQADLLPAPPKHKLLQRLFSKPPDPRLPALLAWLYILLHLHH